MFPNGHTNGVKAGGAHLFPRPADEGLLRAFHQVLKANQSFALPPWGGGRNRFNTAGQPLDKDIEGECGYPENIDLPWLDHAYKRWGIAARVVDVWPDECWSRFPDIYDDESPGDTPFDNSFNALVNRTMLPHFWHRVDRLSRLGQYGLLFFGLDDGVSPAMPPAGLDPVTGLRKPQARKNHQVNFIRAFDQTVLRIGAIDNNRTSPRYGLPKEYEIRFAENLEEGSGDKMKYQRVHWTRCIHVADNLRNSMIFGAPELERVANYIYDVLKVGGSSAEMFYKGGFPGYAFTTNPDLNTGDVDLDEESLKAQIWDYMQGLRRALLTVGGEWKSLAPQVANPAPNLEWTINLICMAINVPVPIFMGTQTGHLAGMKDSDQMAMRAMGRQYKYLEPFMVRPTIDRLVQFGALVKPKKLYCDWRDLRTLSDQERVEVALKKAQALMQYQTGDVNQLMPFRLFMTLIMGFTEAQADAIEAEMKKNPPPEPMQIRVSKESAKVKAAAQPQGGIKKGNAGKSAGGRPKDRPEGSPKKPKAK